MVDIAQTPAPTEQAAAPALDTSVDSMMEFLGGEGKTEGESVEAEGEAAAEEAPEASVEAEEEDGEEQAAPTEAKPEDPAGKKMSRNQRLKAARDAAMAETITEKKNAAQAIGVANYWRTQAQSKDALLAHVLRETGFQLDPRDVTLLEVRQEETRKQFEAQTQKAVEDIDRQGAATREQRALADSYTAQAAALAKTTGVQSLEILQAFALAEQQGFGLSMEQVAQKLARVAPRAATPPAAKQLAANRSAPKTVRGGRVPAPEFDTSLGGMMSFLDSRSPTR